MGQKKIAHGKHESQLDSLKHKLGGLFREIVQEPMEHPAQTESAQQLPINDTELAIEEPSEEEVYQKAREARRDEARDEILSNLNEATKQWKDTGDLGISLEPPVPLRERVKYLWSKMKEGKDAILQSRLKARIEQVVVLAANRIKAARTKGTSVDEEEVIREEWQDVLTKLEETSTPSERDEIESIYEQLSEEEPKNAGNNINDEKLYKD